MAATQGRLMLLKKGSGTSPETFATVAGLTTKSISISNGTLDITTDDSAGIKTLLAGLYAKSFAISASGVSPDTAAYKAIRTAHLAGTHGNWQIVQPAVTGGTTYAGAFAITSFEELGETDGAITFTISMESAGVITVT